MENCVSKTQMNALPHIVAVDFDGCLVEDRFPEIGKIKQSVFDAVKDRQRQGEKIILWTSRDHEMLKQAVEFCTNKGLHFDAINDNLDEVKVLFANNTRKIFADEYWDDKAWRVC